MEGGVIAGESESGPGGPARQTAVSMLLPECDRLLSGAGWQREDIEAVVVGIGPGSFTGIRTAATVARTLCQMLDLPLIGVSSLQCFAWNASEPAAVILSGAPDSFFLAAYADRGRREIARPAYLGLAEMETTLAAVPLWLCDAEAERRLAASGKRLARLPQYENIASIQAQIAWDRLSLNVPSLVGQGSNAALKEEFSWRTVQPLYLRGPSVTLKKPHGHKDQANDAR